VAQVSDLCCHALPASMDARLRETCHHFGRAALPVRSASSLRSEAASVGTHRGADTLSIMEIEPQTLSVRDRYKLQVGAIVPRPIAFVSTVSPEGTTNLAPFSFFNGVGSDPLTLLFCPSNKSDGSEKDTLRNCLDPPAGLGEFVVNVVSEPYAREAAACAEPLDFGESEFDFSGLTPAPAVRVRAPRLAESPFCFECRTERIVRLNPGVTGGGNIVVGAVVWMHARDGLVDERYRVDPEQLAAIGRMAGTTYCTTRQRFDMPRGKAALEMEMPEILRS